MYIKQSYSYLKLCISSTIKYPQGYVLSLARNEKNGFILKTNVTSQVSGPVLTYVLTK